MRRARSTTTDQRLVMGEAAAVLVLGRARAGARRAIYRELVGYGMSSDAAHMTEPIRRVEPGAR